MSCKARPKFVDLQFTPHLTFDKLCVRPCRQSSRGLSLVLVVCTGLLCLSDWQTVNCVSVNRSSPALPPLPTLETPNISVHCRLHSDTSPPLAPPSSRDRGCGRVHRGGQAGAEERPGRGRVEAWEGRKHLSDTCIGLVQLRPTARHRPTFLSPAADMQHADCRLQTSHT